MIAWFRKFSILWAVLLLSSGPLPLCIHYAQCHQVSSTVNSSAHHHETAACSSHRHPVTDTNQEDSSSRPPVTHEHDHCAICQAMMQPLLLCTVYQADQSRQIADDVEFHYDSPQLILVTASVTARGPPILVG